MKSDRSVRHADDRDRILKAPSVSSDEGGEEPQTVSPGEALRSLLDERSQETEAALTIVRRITSSLDLGVVLSESLGLATAVARCQVGAIYLLDDDQKRLWIRATSPGYEQLVDNYSLEVGAGLTGWSALNRMPAVISGHPHDDPRYAPVPAVDLDFNSALTYPMISPRGRMVGVITLHTKAPREFSEKDQIAVAPIAALAAAAVETAQLYTRNQRQIDVLRSVGTVGDALGSPAAMRRVLRDLCDAARLLVGAAAVAIYNRAASQWRLATSVTSSDPPPAEQLPEELIASLLVSDNVGELTLVENRALLEALLPGDKGLLRGTAIRLAAGGEVVGVLLTAGSATSVSAVERELVGVIATVGAMIIQSERLLERLAARDAALSFLQALSSQTEPSGVVEARARQFDVELHEPHVAGTFQVVDRGSGQVEPEHALELLGTELTRRFPQSVTARWGLDLYALIRVDDQPDMVDRIRNTLALTEAQTSLALVGGLSGPVNQLDLYARMFTEARDATQIGKHLKGAGHLVHYDELGAQHHLWTLARSSVRDPLQERLEALAVHDAEHGTKFVETVREYLQQHGNRERASARLHIHRNTLRQRIDRIRELSGIDLEQTDVLFDLQIALGIVQFRELQQGARESS
jgi:sugar diacid utilization regulator